MIYVDDAFIPYRRMLMCHMFADSHEELIQMAISLGLKPEWIQKAGTPHEHFDISKGKREEAIRRGAVPITRKQVYDLLTERRRVQVPLGTNDK